MRKESPFGIEVLIWIGGLLVLFLGLLSLANAASLETRSARALRNPITGVGSVKKLEGRTPQVSKRLR